MSDTKNSTLDADIICVLLTIIPIVEDLLYRADHDLAGPDHIHAPGRFGARLLRSALA
jgi:hypothetical protein